MCSKDDQRFEHLRATALKLIEEYAHNSRPDSLRDDTVLLLADIAGDDIYSVIGTPAVSEMLLEIGESKLREEPLDNNVPLHVKLLVAKLTDDDELSYALARDSYNSSLRAVSVGRLRSEQAEDFVNDPSWMVRMEVAKIIDKSKLITMFPEEHKYVQTAIVRRIDPSHFLEIIDYVSPVVLGEFAPRLRDCDIKQFLGYDLSQVPDYSVIYEVAKKIPVQELKDFKDNKNAVVRVAVAERIGIEHLFDMKDDPERQVREIVERRLSSK